MTCTDCGEEINEVERRSARACCCCALPMHAECSMVGIKDDDTCERCLHKESAGYDDAMKVNANLRNGGEEQWYQALGTPEEKS